MHRLKSGEVPQEGLAWRRKDRVTASIYVISLFIYFLWHFRPFPGHDLHVFLPPLTPLSLRCEPFFFVFSNMTRSSSASSSHLFIDLPAGFLPPKLPSTIYFWILLLNVLNTRKSYFSICTCMYVARSLGSYSLRCFMFCLAIDLCQSLHFPKDLFLVRTDRVYGAWTVVSSVKTSQAACCSARVVCWRIEVQYLIPSWRRVPSPVRPVRRWQKQPSSYTNCVSCLSQLEVDCLPVSLLVCGSPAG